jgi:hypothetical protein
MPEYQGPREVRRRRRGDGEQGETDLPRLVVAQDVSHVREQIRSLPAAVNVLGRGDLFRPFKSGILLLDPLRCSLSQAQK